MDPRLLFADERHAAFCIFCAAPPTTREHVASKVFLDDPLPDNLPVAHSCRSCNEGHSEDEAYVACLIECVLSGSTNPEHVHRKKVQGILRRSPALAARIARGRSEVQDVHLWKPEEDRVRRVVLKLARGLVAYEHSEPRFDEPEEITITPLPTMSADQREYFERPLESTYFPEIGSRAFLKLETVDLSHFSESTWTVLQEGRYRYVLTQPGELVVRIVLSEYLACEIVWQ
jgi:hypothetical protein